MANAFSSFMNITGNATADLAGGFGAGAQYGGDQLQNDLTDEEKKRRKLLQQQGSMTSGSALGGLSVPALFGNYGR